MQVVAPGKFLFVLEQPSTINHIVIFLTGTILELKCLMALGEERFEDGTGASVYFNTDTGATQGADWKFLGVLTNAKPSAVFKLSGLSSSSNVNSLEIGISIEPIAVLEQILMESSSQAIIPVASMSAMGANIDTAGNPFGNTPRNTPSNTMPRPLTVAQHIGENLFNYIASFSRMAVEVAQVEPTVEVVPVRAVQEWFNMLVRRATTDPEGFMRQFDRTL